MTEKVSRFNPLVYVFIVYQCQVFNIGQSISKSKGFTGCHIKNIDSIKNELTTSTLFILHGKIYIYIYKTEANSESSQTSEMEFFVKIVTG